MADKPTGIDRDYGHRIYMEADDYMSAMKRPADKHYDNFVKRPHSDDKKPYWDDEYPEMEHYWTPYDPPNFTPPGIPDDPKIPPMNPDQPGGDPGEHEPGEAEFDGCLFKIPRGPFVVGNGETTFSGIGFDAADPISRLYINYGPADLLINVSQLNNCLTAPIASCLVSAQVKETFNPDDYAKIGDDYFPVQVVAVTRKGFTCAWDFMATNCPPETEFSWDTDNNPETIGPSAQEPIYVLGGTTPFEWSVTGTGFTLAASKTAGRANTLKASAGACGHAAVTITDACDTVITGEVRCTNGTWVFIGNDCVAPGPYDDTWSDSYRNFDGGYYNVQRLYGYHLCNDLIGGRCSCSNGSYGNACANFVPPAWGTPCVVVTCSERTAGFAPVGSVPGCCQAADGRRCRVYTAFLPDVYRWDCP